MSIPDDNPVFDESGGLVLNIHFHVKNIGKSPAFEAGNGFQTYIGYEGAEEAFGAIRQFTELRSFSRGITIFPGDSDDWSTSETITASQIEQSQAIKDRGLGQAMQFIIVSYQYKSSFTCVPLETVRMYSFGVGYSEGELPTFKEAAGKKVRFHLWKELVT